MQPRMEDYQRASRVLGQLGIGVNPERLKRLIERPTNYQAAHLSPAWLKRYAGNVGKYLRPANGPAAELARRGVIPEDVVDRLALIRQLENLLELQCRALTGDGLGLAEQAVDEITAIIVAGFDLGSARC